MIAALLNRLISLFIVILGVLTIVFFSLHLAPGDPVEVMLGERSSQADRQTLRENLGLNKSITEQYHLYLKRLIKGDLGQSIHQKKPVSTIIANRVGNTLKLALISMFIAVLIALPLAFWAARNPYKYPDNISMTLSLLGISIPNFVLGPLLILVFSFWLKWLPTGGDYYENSWVLPSIALGTAMAALLSRLLRTSLLQAKKQSYILSARAKGISEIRCWFVHILPNSLLPVITVFGLQLGTLLGGAVITEIVFSWQGIGSLLIHSIEQRDYLVVQGCILVISLAYILVNMLIDVLYIWIDPRTR